MAKQRSTVAKQRSGVAKQRSGIAKQDSGIAKQSSGAVKRRSSATKRRSTAARQRSGAAKQRSSSRRTRRTPAPPRPATESRSRARGEITSAEPAREPPALRNATSPTIVGIGASAGGLEACSQLLHALPPDTGMAIVVVQHLLPTHASALPELLAGSTSLPTVQVTEGLRIEPNHVYVIPPNVHMGVRGGRFHLSPRLSGHHMPIDHFLSSLASHAGERAIGVVLSGTASDGALGLREIKAAGGMTIAQEPETAKHDGMPRAAIATGAVDLVLSPEQIGPELARISRHSRVRVRKPQAESEESSASGDPFRRVLTLLRSGTGVDFSGYKPPTIRRRLERRMVQHRIPDLARYVRYLEGNPTEVRNLYEDIFIHATKFFRDPAVFRVLAERVFPRLLKDRAKDTPVRFWIPGCSTGEDAYSLAISFLEFLGDDAARVPIQVFATDVSERSIEQARAGVYPENVANDISPERLRRFFTHSDSHWRIQKTVRDTCVFARQDLTRDPPFSKLDLILCRNLLIYLKAEMQRRVISVCHYALKPNGFLVLGPAETVGAQAELFSLFEKKSRIYQRKGGHGLPPQGIMPHTEIAVTREAQPAKPLRASTFDHALGDVNRLLLDRYGPAGVLVDSDMHIVHFRGENEGYLRSGLADSNLSHLLREGLLHPVRQALQEVRRTRRGARKRAVHVQSDGTLQEIEVEILPILVSTEHPYFLVLFHDVAKGPTTSKDGKAGKRTKISSRSPEARVLESLRQELTANREYLHSIIQDLEGANEELQSANEEVLSSNEELQSTNEELDTAKEELQSTNEELSTLNEELHGRNEELARVNSDLVNLIASVQVAIVIVSSDLRIRRFTPLAERILNLIPGDVGRRIGQIKPNLDCPDLERLILQAVDAVSSSERVVADPEGHRYSMRIRPYKDIENRIDGAVVTLFDLESVRRGAPAAEVDEEFAEAILETSRSPLLVLDDEHRIRALNAAFRRMMDLGTEVVTGKPVYALGHGTWDLPSLRRLIRSVVEPSARVEDAEIDLPLSGGGSRKFVVNLRRTKSPVDDGWSTLIAFEEAEDGSKG